jgi:hypothetical protein
MSLFSRIAAVAGSVEFALYGDTCQYLPRAGEGFDVHYVRHEPEIAQAEVTGAYYADLEVRLAEFLVPPRRGDEVDLDGVRYVVAKVVTPAQANTIIALHRKADV